MAAVAVPETDTRTTPDLPFYNGLPTAISGAKWLVVVAACAVAFAQLTLLPIPGGDIVERWVHVILLPAIPLAALAWAAPQGWTAIFRKLRIRDFFLMIGFGALALVTTFVVAAPLADLVGANANPAGDILADASTGERLQFFAASIPQLIGEELITILPMLALISVLVRTLHWSRNAALAVAWIGTAVMFGALHLPTYGWNIVQALAFIGFARLLLTLAYVVTKNVWVSSGAHIINDWAMFSLPLVLGGAALL